MVYLPLGLTVECSFNRIVCRTLIRAMRRQVAKLAGKHKSQLLKAARKRKLNPSIDQGDKWKRLAWRRN
jgi:hypothetical protein